MDKAEASLSLYDERTILFLQGIEFRNHPMLQSHYLRIVPVSTPVTSPLPGFKEIIILIIITNEL